MKKQLGKNLLLNIIYNLLSMAVPLISAPYLGRVLGASNVGIYTYFFMIASYFVMFGLLGISNYGTKMIASYRDDRVKRSKIFWELYFMQLFTAGISMVAYVFFILSVYKSNAILQLIMGLYVASALMDASWYFSGTEKFKQIVIRNTLIKILTLVSVLTIVRNEDDLVLYFFIMAFSYLLSAVALWPYIFIDVDFYKPKTHDWIKHIKYNILLFVPAVSASIYQNLAKIMIGNISGNQQLAYYEYADKILSIPIVIFGAIGAVMLSRMSNIIQNNNKDTKILISLFMDLTFFISVGFVMGVFAISEEFILLYYGKQFQASIVILRILLPSLIFYGFNNVLRMQYIIPTGKDHLYITSTILAAIINLLFNLTVIPILGAKGAGIGNVIAQMVISIYFIYRMHNELPLKEYIMKNKSIMLSGIFMFMAIKFIQLFHENSLFGLMVDIVVGLFIYLLTSYLLFRNNKKHLINYISLIIFKERQGRKNERK